MAVPLCVLGISIAITVAALLLAKTLIDSSDNQRFLESKQDIVDKLSGHIEQQVALLKATAAFIANEPRPSYSQYREFLSRQSTTKSLPGIAGIGYCVNIPRSKLPELVRFAHGQGFKDFHIWPPAEGNAIQCVLYFDPLPPRGFAGFGYNMASDSEKNEAMIRAVDLGEPTVTRRVVLVHDAPSTSSFVIYVPIFSGKGTPSTPQDRAARLLGFAYSPFRASKVFADISQQECYYQLYAVARADPKNILIDGAKTVPSGYRALYRHAETLLVLNRVWELVSYSSPSFNGSSSRPILPWIVASGGAISLLLFFLTADQTRARRAAEIYAQTLERREASQSLLARAGVQLGSSLDYEATLASVAQLAVPTFADWCAVDTLLEDGSIHRIAVAHVDPERVKWARQLAEEIPPNPDAPTGVPAVLRNGKSEMYPEISAAMLENANLNERQRELIKGLHLSSVMIVPMITRGRTFGAITLVWGESGHHYGQEELRVAEELAERAALAIDNSRLFASAQQEISERRRAEEQVQEMNEGLENLVAERTRDLRNANEELEAFCYSVSHDLRAPLRSVDGFSRALEEDYRDKLDDDGIDYIKRVRAASKRMDSLITALLTLSRLTRAEIHPVQIDLTSLAVQTVAEYDPKNRCETEIQPGLTVCADPHMIRVVMENLISNAVKFSNKSDHPKIEIGSEDGAIYIKDNGAGFNPEYSAKLFMPFERLHTDREFPGSGIGLATAARILKRHGGIIWAQSEPDKGAIFYFSLPPATDSLRG